MYKPCSKYIHNSSRKFLSHQHKVNIQTSWTLCKTLLIHLGKWTTTIVWWIHISKISTNRCNSAWVWITSSCKTRVASIQWCNSRTNHFQVETKCHQECNQAWECLRISQTFHLNSNKWFKDKDLAECKTWACVLVCRICRVKNLNLNKWSRKTIKTQTNSSNSSRCCNL